MHSHELVKLAFVKGLLLASLPLLLLLLLLQLPRTSSGQPIAGGRADELLANNTNAAAADAAGTAEAATNKIIYDQRQSGKYNIRINIDGVSIIEMDENGLGEVVTSDEDYYYYDDDDLTVKPLILTTPATTEAAASNSALTQTAMTQRATLSTSSLSSKSALTSPTSLSPPTTLSSLSPAIQSILRSSPQLTQFRVANLNFNTQARQANQAASSGALSANVQRITTSNSKPLLNEGEVEIAVNTPLLKANVAKGAVNPLRQPITATKVSESSSRVNLSTGEVTTAPAVQKWPIPAAAASPFVQALQNIVKESNVVNERKFPLNFDKTNASPNILEFRMQTPDVPLSSFVASSRYQQQQQSKRCQDVSGRRRAVNPASLLKQLINIFATLPVVLENGAQ